MTFFLRLIGSHVASTGITAVTARDAVGVYRSYLAHVGLLADGPVRVAVTSLEDPRERIYSVAVYGAPQEES